MKTTDPREQVRGLTLFFKTFMLPDSAPTTTDSPQPVVALVSRHFWEVLVVLAAFATLAVRLWALTSRYAVNVFFMDQWDFHDATVFQRHSLWEMFRWQHGPHRMGLGALLAYLVEPHFAWSSRADSFLAAILVIAAAGCALELKRRLFGPLTVFDVCIPLIFLTPLQFEAVFVMANLAQGPIPLLLVLIYCLSWTLSSLALRYSLIVFINFVAIHTGYCFFLGVITPVALAADYWLNRKEQPSRFIPSLVALLLSLASLAIFFYHYRYTTAVDCVPNLLSDPLSNVKFLMLLFANLFGAKGTGFFPTLAGALTFAAVLTALFVSALDLARLKGPQSQRSWTTAILLSFGLLFSINATYARSCLGPQLAQVSRYVIWMDLSLFGLYLFLLTVPKSGMRTGILTLLTAALLGTIPIRREDRSVMQFVSTAKRNWKSCYLQIEDIRRCNHAVGYGVNPTVTPEFKAKLEFLKQTKQNLYSGE